jgi:hypothetical protein
VLLYLALSGVIASVSYVLLLLLEGLSLVGGPEQTLAAGSSLLVPWLIGVISTLVFLRPMVRARTILGPVLAALALPFVSGVACSIGLAVFGGLSSVALVVQVQQTYNLIQSSQIIVVGTVLWSLPVSAAAVVLLRRSDPPELLAHGKLATVDPYAG